MILCLTIFFRNHSLVVPPSDSPPSLHPEHVFHSFQLFCKFILLIIKCVSMVSLPQVFFWHHFLTLLSLNPSHSQVCFVSWSGFPCFPTKHQILGITTLEWFHNFQYDCDFILPILKYVYNIVVFLRITTLKLD